MDLPIYRKQIKCLSQWDDITQVYQRVIRLFLSLWVPWMPHDVSRSKKVTIYIKCNSRCEFRTSNSNIKFSIINNSVLLYQVLNQEISLKKNNSLWHLLPHLCHQHQLTVQVLSPWWEIAEQTLCIIFVRQASTTASKLTMRVVVQHLSIIKGWSVLQVKKLITTKIMNSIKTSIKSS